MRSGGRWGPELTLEILTARLKDLLYDVPEYSPSMVYQPFPYDVVQSIRAVGECYLCGRRSKDGAGFIAHHRDPLGPGTLENGRCLDKTCHSFISFMIRKVKGYPRGATRESYFAPSAPRAQKDIPTHARSGRRMTAKQKRALYALGDPNFKGNRAQVSQHIKELIEGKPR